MDQCEPMCMQILGNELLYPNKIHEHFGPVKFTYKSILRIQYSSIKIIHQKNKLKMAKKNDNFMDTVPGLLS